jgi:hypothetical protein
VLDVTDLMDDYRNVAQSGWNEAFWSRPNLRDWDSRERFEHTGELLFNILVIIRRRRRCVYAPEH